MRAGELFVKEHKRDSLRILGSVGEPINPEAWRWCVWGRHPAAGRRARPAPPGAALVQPSSLVAAAPRERPDADPNPTPHPTPAPPRPRYHDVVGDGKCPIVDTWWQTETGGHMITPLPNAWQQKPGSATLPFFGAPGAAGRWAGWWLLPAACSRPAPPAAHFSPPHKPPYPTPTPTHTPRRRARARGRQEQRAGRRGRGHAVHQAGVAQLPAHRVRRPRAVRRPRGEAARRRGAGGALAAAALATSLALRTQQRPSRPSSPPHSPSPRSSQTPNDPSIPPNPTAPRTPPPGTRPTTLPPSRATTSPATARAATRTATTGSRGAWTTSSTCLATGGFDRGGVGGGCR
jgi:hypothetical protein